MITNKSCIEFLTKYQEWRRGDEHIDMPFPHDIGLHIDYAINSLKEIESSDNRIAKND